MFSRMVLLIGLLFPVTAMAQMGPPDGSQGGPPGGEGRTPPRPPKPIKREKFDRVVTAMFRDADADHDGQLTVSELNAMIAARREVVIHERFRRIDRNRNGTIEPDEFSAWQQEMGSVAESEVQSAGPGGMVAEAVRPRLGDDIDDRLLLGLIEPIGSITIINADANSDGRTSLSELLAYEGKRFEAADVDHDGELTMTEARGPDEPGTMRLPGDGFPGRPPR